MEVQAFNPGTLKVNLCEVEASLVYKVHNNQTYYTILAGGGREETHKNNRKAKEIETSKILIKAIETQLSANNENNIFLKLKFVETCS